MKFNIYYLFDGDSYTIENVALSRVGAYAADILKAGSEITGIINMEDDN